MKRLHFNILPLVVVMGVAVWSVWPVIKNFATAFAFGGDDALITWQLNQWGKNFQGNIFYPYKNTAAYHMLLVPSGIIGYLPVKITGSPVAAYNTAIIVSQLMTALVLYLWFREMAHPSPKASDGAMVGAVAFIWCQIRMAFQIHIHMWISQWLVIAGWMLWRWRQNGRVWQLYTAGLFLAVQFWESIYQAYWILILGGILLLPRIKELFKIKKHLVIIALGVGGLISPVLKVYGEIYREFGFGGSIRESANFSMSINDLWGSWLSPGLYVLLLVALIRIFKIQITNYKQIPKYKLQITNSETKWLLILLLVGVILAMGPVLKWEGETVKILGKIFIPLPYGIFYYLIPGFSVLRSVHRFMWLGALGGAGLIAISLVPPPNPPPKLGGGTKGGGMRKTIAILSALLVAIVGGTTVQRDKAFPMPKDYPAVYDWLAGQPGKAILEYPVYLAMDKNYSLEMYRMVYSLKHGKNLVGGAAGYMPEERGELLAKIQTEYPSTELNRTLKNMGVDYVVVHRDETEKEIGEYMDLKKIWEDEKTAVYRI